MKKVVFVAKTNLNNDGRILNELKILKDFYVDQFSFDFILMPDKPLTIEITEIDNLHILDSNIRNNKFLRAFTVFDFTLQCFKKLKQIKPEIIHAQDTAITLPILLYKKYVDTKVVVIYDDHEVPNENEGVSIRLFQYFESRLMQLSQKIITANKERLLYLAENNRNFDRSRADYFLNLPYFEDVNLSKEFTLSETIKLLKQKQEANYKYIMHQGIIEVERGRDKLADFSEKLDEVCKILIVGVSKEYFNNFLEEYKLDGTKFIFVGSVPYFELAEYWRLVDASIVMYLPTYLNNKLCAPNRLYISFLNSIPIIVNKNNPVLSNFIEENTCGLYIEDINKNNIENIWSIKYTSDKIEGLKTYEKSKLVDIYKEFN
ncbi:hypothetical protein HXZ91_04620 [Myroides odoratimimus]|uniref:hypothetical protein n=1 Tax=Myroides odoratimimus TaxID=76832 RepID=UPI002576F4C0|nr:hypothetical protein [Myroides odoratimimus]MDM1033763.1 hypothetical protein [Myroides odoratimimus]